MSFAQHVNEEKYKLLLSTIVSSIGFLVALLVNSGLDRSREEQSYRSMVQAIKVEAQANREALETGFLKYFEAGVVLQQFSTSVATQYLATPTFLKFSPKDDVSRLTQYVRLLTLSNKYREKVETIRLDPGNEIDSGVFVKVWKTNLEQCAKAIASIEGLQ